MSEKRVVVALGHQALGTDFPGQYKAVHSSVKVLADLIEDGCQLIITHSNAPQVGLIHTALNEYAKNHETSNAPMSICSSMSQGFIGYDIQNKLREELLDRGIKKDVTSVLTQVLVDPDDPAFDNPTKPIGPFLTKEEAEAKKKLRNHVFIEDAGRGYRRVVASPEPKAIIEIDTIRTLADAGHIVIAAGGGGIPVTKAENNHLKGSPAVIDKDRASELLAEELDADFLIILTAVENAMINYKKPGEKKLGDITTEEAKKYIAEGQFAPGSMLPKVEAAVKFAESKPGRVALITLLEKARDGIQGKTGTRIHA